MILANSNSDIENDLVLELLIYFWPCTFRNTLLECIPSSILNGSQDDCVSIFPRSFVLWSLNPPFVYCILWSNSQLSWPQYPLKHSFIEDYYNHHYYLITFYVPLWLHHNVGLILDFYWGNYILTTCDNLNIPNISFLC